MAQISIIGKSQLNLYFNESYEVTDFDTNSPYVFLLLPKTHDGLDIVKEYVLDKKPKHIVKLGSLGPYRLIHKQLEEFLKETDTAFTSFDCAPFMNHIFIEQYENGKLENYRGNATAPYLDPVCVASAIEQCFGDERHYNKTYHATGDVQYNIKDIAKDLQDNGFIVDEITNTGYDTTHKALSNLSPDFKLMKLLGRAYIDDEWAPKVSKDLQTHFGTQSRTFAQFVQQDRDLYSKTFDWDRYL